MDTIFAEATAPGKAGVAIIRISGPDAFAACQTLAGDTPPSHRAALRVLRDSAGWVLDTGLVLCFSAGRSFTGEDVVELHLHGSRAVVSATLAELGTLDGLRSAGPGEFTRRALENERLDLTQVEGLADLIEAETEFQRLQAQEVLSGALTQKVMRWRTLLIEAAALIEATLDFVDEDVPVDVGPDVLSRLNAVQSDLNHEIDGYGASERIRDGYEVAILGPPNIGKSTLLNAIARRDVALTSDIAGTTRDVIEVRTNIGGLPVTFLDTAGLRETQDPLESAGIEKARSRARKSDLRVFLSSDGQGDQNLYHDGDLRVIGKSDVGGGDVSGLTGEGIDDLIANIAHILRGRAMGASVAIRDRHISAMTSASALLSTALAGLTSGENEEVVSYTIRSATMALEEIIGRVDVDDLLSDIFSRFCIGK